MKVRFIFCYDGYCIQLYKNWNMPFFPSLGHSIEVIEYMTEVERKKADETKLIYSDSENQEIETTLYGFLTDSYGHKVTHVSWRPDQIDIELHRDYDVVITSMGSDDLTDDIYKYSTFTNKPIEICIKPETEIKSNENAFICIKPDRDIQVLTEGIDTSEFTGRVPRALAENELSTYGKLLAFLLKHGKWGLYCLKGLGEDGITQIETHLIKKGLIEQPSNESKGKKRIFYTSKYKNLL